MSEYTKQAELFLAKHGITFKAKLVGSDCPKFCDGKHIHGYHYRCTFTNINRPKGKLIIDFWNSYVDAHEGREPEPYDVLSCITKNEPGSFEEFCNEYGYDTDSREAEATYKGVKAEWLKVSGFFTAEELAEIQEIN